LQIASQSPPSAFYAGLCGISFEIDGARDLQIISRTALPTVKDSLRRYVTKHQIVSVVEYRKVYQFIGKSPKDPSLEGWSRI